MGGKVLELESESSNGFKKRRKQRQKQLEKQGAERLEKQEAGQLEKQSAKND